MLVWKVLFLCCTILNLRDAGAQDRTLADPYRFFAWPVEDARALAREATTPRMLYVVAGGGLIALLSSQDDRITEEAIRVEKGSIKDVTRAIEEFGNVHAMRPVAAMILIGSFVSGDPRLQDAAFTSLEAVVVSNLITDGLKTVIGRARPFQDRGPGNIKPFSGNTSFPSGHATTVFAFITPWVLYYPGALTTGFLVLGSATAFTRVTKEMHWFSDILAGAAIGSGIGYFLARRHINGDGRFQVTPVYTGNQAGLSIRFIP